MVLRTRTAEGKEAQKEPKKEPQKKSTWGNRLRWLHDFVSIVLKCLVSVDFSNCIIFLYSSGVALMLFSGIYFHPQCSHLDAPDRVESGVN